ncbi:APC family permease [Halostella salina]|uniref:APC family permease n=1 Tax=Halostella salina TaxID=1547897 RepID=UPI000EF83DFF|nr:APC family permease [Halostella salina]
MSGRFGLTEAVAIALGGMIGGGIYAVLGVVVKVSGALAWLAFAIAGGVALCAGYSYVVLNRACDDRGGSPTFIESFAGSSTLAGMAGWTLLVGYVGSMAMYAFAFGSYFVDIAGLGSVAGVPARPAVSALVVAAFVGLNLVGVKETGLVEVVLVAAKIAVLAGFVALGLAEAVGGDGVATGVGSVGAGPVVAAAVSFVAFQGWQLLLYDQDAIADPVETIRRAIYVSIPVAVLVYVGVAVVTTSLVETSLVVRHPETALAAAAERFGGGTGRLVISLSALFSTASAINATLFSGVQFADGLVADGLMPDRFEGDGAGAVPPRIVLGLGALTLAFTVYGSLQGITSFASLAFIVVFGAMSYLALGEAEGWSRAVPAVGLAGTALFLPLLLWHLYADQRGVFVTVLAAAALVLAVELAYFERGSVAEGIRRVEKRI